MFKNIFHRRLALVVLILLICIPSKTLPAQSSNKRFTDNTSERTQKPTFLIPSIAKQNKPIALIVVQQDDEWLAAAASPAAAKIRQVNKTPILLKWASKENPRQKKMLEQLAPVTGFCTILSSNTTFTLEQINDNSTICNIPTKSDSAQTSLLLAGHFWQKADSVVMASRYDPAAIIMGSALASHCCIPLIVSTGKEQLNAISQKLNSLDVSRIIYVASKNNLADSRILFPSRKTEIIGIEETQKRLIQKLRAPRIQNIILFRVPDNSTDEGSISWLAPYLSLIHGSALVPCYSSDPSAAQSKIESLIRRYSLRPRTITILGDYEAVDIVMTTEDDPNAYEISAELSPSLPPGQAAWMGIGRIPFRQLWAASTLIAYGVARDHILAQQQPNVLMIANPSTDYSSLPLCETISRATAAEFKNLGIKTNEFYGISCNNELLRSSVENSQFIIYEGHISDFSLFGNPSYYEDEAEIYSYEYEQGQNEYYSDTTDFRENETDDYYDSSDEDYNSHEAEMNTQEQNKQTDSDYYMPDEDVDSRHYEISQTTEPCKLDAIPLVAIQSCHSLDDTVLDILTSGAIGIIGSKTNIHSASGSSFIKAFCDGLLYRSDTIGEAMRDAKNYLLCVSALKKARGHTQYAKVERVAYSFHFWGDPELRIFSGLQNRQKIEPVSGTFTRPDKITVTIPNKRLPTSRTDKYFLRMFPGSEAAGILKRIKDKEIRRVAPIYFFRIPMAKGFEPSQYAGLKKADDTTVRAVFFVDSFRRFLYIVYFPEKEEKEEVFTLQFIKREVPAGIQS
jgi:hypothetical protein